MVLPALRPTLAPPPGEPAWFEPDPRPLDWNGPAGRPFVPVSPTDLEQPIAALVASAARRRRDRLAVTDGSTSLSYGALWSGACGLAERVAARTAPGELIALVLPASPLFPLAMLACLAAGRPFVALDPSFPADWLGQVLADARPALILAPADGLPGVETGATPVLGVTCGGSPSAAWRPAAFGPDEPACVLFTSGSTGRPKGIVNSQRNLLQRVAQSINAAHINADDRLLTLASPSTIVGVRDLLTALVAGASVRLIDPGKAGAREVLDLLRTEGVTILFAFPALLRSVVAGASGGPADAALRLVRVGGDTTLWSDIDLLRAWLAPDAAVQLVYAATEAPMMQWFVDDACRGDDPRIPIGYPLSGNRLALVDDDGGPTPPGEAGELVVEGPYVTLGRWIDGRCVPDDPERSAPRRFSTGDLARLRPDGLLERLGRKDRQVKVRGVRVDLDGVEAVLRQHPHVRDVGALVRTRDDGAGATLVAYISARDGAPAGLGESLKAIMRSQPPAMRPQRFYRTETIPRLPGSKLDLRGLMALDEANARAERADAGADRDADRGDRVSRAVAKVWRDLLHRPADGPDDDFFDAGGDSLNAIAFMMELERALGLELPLTLIHEAPTFGTLCAALRDQRTGGYVPLVPLKAGDGLPPVFIVHGLGGSVADLFPLARRMTYPGPVIGIQARGQASGVAAHTTVEAMATDYLDAVKAQQPRGPYYLCGYSFGGLVAFEMARRLRQAGDEVGLLGLFDTLTSPASWPLPVWLGVLRRRLARFVAAPWRSRRADRLPAALRSAPAGVLRVAASALMASARYRPGFYPGELTLFTPAGRDPSLPLPDSIWRRHAASLSVVPTAGGHITMLATPHAESTAEALTRRLPAAHV